MGLGNLLRLRRTIGISACAIALLAATGCVLRGTPECNGAEPTILLSWSSVSDTNMYWVARSPSWPGGARFVVGLTTVDEGVEAGVDYTYTLYANVDGLTRRMNEIVTTAPTCSGDSCTPSIEVCDGVDNDCDGDIDEDDVCTPACTPTAEVCDGVDNDCDAQIDEGCEPPPAEGDGDFLSVGVVGGQYYDEGRAIAATADGGTVVVGAFAGTVDFGGEVLQAEGFSSTKDGFIAKYRADGSLAWVKRFGSTGNEKPEDVAIDSAGHVVVVGSYEGSANFGGSTLVGAGNRDIFLVALRGADGGHLFSKSFGTANNDQATGVAVDAADNIIVIGDFDGTVSFGGTNLVSNRKDAFIAKFSATGSHLWSAVYGGQFNDSGRDVAVDASGQIALGVDFQEVIDFGGPALTSVGDVDVAVAKLGANGEHLWSRRVGGAAGEKVRGIEVDAAGNVFATGVFLQSVDFGGGVVVANGTRDNVYLASYAGNTGAFRWARTFGQGSSQDQSNALATDSAGNVIITGRFLGTADFGMGPVTSSSNSFDIFVAKYANNGAPVWANQYGSWLTNDAGQDVAVDAQNNILSTGFFEFQSDFGDGNRRTAGFTDTYFLRLTP